MDQAPVCLLAIVQISDSLTCALTRLSHLKHLVRTMKNRHDVNLAAFPLLSPLILTVFLLISLFYLPTTRAIAQNAPLAASAPSGDQVFADFESGTFDGWTIQGDCWGKAPATDDLFNGQITGFQGQSFACTLSPRRGCVATGRATSRDFIIQKPFIRFLIGGGNFPGQACLNLIVDGKTVQTATGDGTAALRRQEWDVTALRGKTAHLEIVDSTEDAHRGYVLIDNIIFADRSILGNTPSAAANIATASSPLPTTPDCLMTLTPTHTVKTTLDFTLSAKSASAGKLHAWGPVPEDLPGQHIESSSLVCTNHPEVKAAIIADQNHPNRKLFSIVAPLKAGELDNGCNFRLTYVASLSSMSPPRTSTGTPALDPNLKQEYLAPEAHIDFNDPGFQTWVKEKNYVKSASETDLNFTHRVFRSLVANGKYAEGGDADSFKPSRVCQSSPTVTDCGGYSLLLAAILRNSNVPCRVCYGHWTTTPDSTDGGVNNPQDHVLLQAWDSEHYGWYNVDVSVAITGCPNDPDQCFGRSSGRFLTFSQDTDYRLSSNALVPAAQGMFASWGGTSDGPHSYKEAYSVVILK